MRLGAGGWILSGCVVSMAPSALGANLSAALKNYYAEYEVVIQCEAQSQLSESDADKAEDAIDMIETHYSGPRLLHRYEPADQVGRQG